MAVILIPAGHADAAWEPVLGDDLMTRLATCETGNNTAHASRSFVTAFGLARQTFDLFADTPSRRAGTLSWAQQARIVDRVFWFGHTEQGRKQWAVGPWGHGCFKLLWVRSVELRDRVCHNARERVRRWCRP